MIHSTQYIRKKETIDYYSRKEPFSKGKLFKWSIVSFYLYVSSLGACNFTDLYISCMLTFNFNVNSSCVGWYTYNNAYTYYSMYAFDRNKF